MANQKGQGPAREHERMLADAVLPANIRPESTYRGAAPRVAFITGACGFLGAQVAQQLLQQTELHLICLVRDRGEETAASRLARSFAGMGISQEEMASRVEVLVGDITEPDLGLDAASYAALAERVDLIYHCAAKVDWVRSYGLLQKINVGGVLAMIRLACKGIAKRLLFVSSVAVCYATNGPEQVDEETDMLPYIASMPLGYARSKCVSEALLRQAAARGVAVTVLRPALIAGNSTNGESSPTDFIAALLQGCVVSGMAIDTDWLLDCVPVDFVARVMVNVSQGDASWQMLHLMHQQPRHWRELVLWMNLHGYPVALTDSDSWIQHLFVEQHARGTMLYAQRQFFCGRHGGRGAVTGSRPYEAYLAAGQARISDRRSRRLLSTLQLHEAPLNADLLHAYFDDYRRSEVLPQRAAGEEPSLMLDELFSRASNSHDSSGGVERWAVAQQQLIGTDDGLLSEIASARVRYSVGLRSLRLEPEEAYGNEQPDVAVLKLKVSDRLLHELTVEMARVCKPQLGILFGQYSDAFGLALSHERELALYELDEPRLRQYMPACYGTLRAPEVGRWGVLLEYLPEAASNRVMGSLVADEDGMETILHDLAQIHAVWFEDREEPVAKPWLVATPEPARMLAMTPLWQGLADFAAPWFKAWCGPEFQAIQAGLIDDLGQWYPRLHKMPTTLIHNDFNPRNFVLREIDGAQRLCVYDWELATLGVPQHDLAELLCFVWHAGLGAADLEKILETSRIALSKASGKEIDPTAWREGFFLSLQYLLLNRLSLYTLMHRFRTLHYLPRVLTNWQRLYSLA